eukprot:00213.XXX_123_239_1 [CDS] Oithona nana genome sequencing.
MKAIHFCCFFHLSRHDHQFFELKREGLTHSIFEPGIRN